MTTQGYRAPGASFSQEELVELVENPSAPAEHRIGAAIALGETGDATLRQRVRIAAEACANPKMRVALDGIANCEPDEEAIDFALAEAKASAGG